MEEMKEIKKLSMGERIKYFFINPSKVFEQYIEKPTVWIKIIIIAVITIFGAIQKGMQKDIFISKTLEKYQSMKMPAQLIESTKKSLEMTVSAPYLILMSIISLAILIVIASLIYWAFTSLFKGKISFGQTVAVYTLATMPKYILIFLQSLYGMVTNSYVGLNAALNPTYLSAFTNTINIFSLWAAVLLVIGLSKVGNISKKKSTIIVIIILVILLLVSMGSVVITQFSSSMMSRVQ